MRDTDRDLTSVFVVRADSPYQTVDRPAGSAVALGAVDSPQATLIPLAHLRGAGLRRTGLRPSGASTSASACTATTSAANARRRAPWLAGRGRAGLHGRRATTSLRPGGHAVPPASTRVLAQTPAFDHCNMTVVDTAPAEEVERLRELLLSMSYADREVRPLLDLEGLTGWQPGRATGYDALETAVDESASTTRTDG